jgi:hypothetical protein
MAIHYSIPSLLKESMMEYLAVSDFCVKYRKDKNVWGAPGCFGYSAAVLLLAIADAIGSYVIGGSTEDHFKILNHRDFYNLGLTEEELELVYKDHRCLLTHNATLSLNVGLSIGEGKKNTIEHFDNKLYLNLEPFLALSKEVVNKFLNNAEEIVNSSKQIKKILNRN